MIPKGKSTWSRVIPELGFIDYDMIIKKQARATQDMRDHKLGESGTPASRRDLEYKQETLISNVQRTDINQRVRTEFQGIMEDMQNRQMQFNLKTLKLEKLTVVIEPLEVDKENGEF